jgi:hypothetical protein
VRSLAGATIAAVATAAALASGLTSAHGARSTRLHTLGRVEVATFSLINAVCTQSQEQVGRGCWDQQALDKTNWAVHDGTATWTEATYTAAYTWSVPQQIPPSGGDASLAIRTNDISNNSGIDERICVLQGFTQFQVKGGDQCAEAFAKTPGSSASASKTATLLPMSTPVDQACPGGGFGCVTLEISLGDGGNVYYTYRASESKLVTVNYTFLGIYSERVNLSAVSSLKVQALGRFDFKGPVGKHAVEGQHLTGSASVEVHFTDHPQVLHSARLVPTRVRYLSPNVANITYRVTSSDIFCLHEHRQYQIAAVEFRMSGRDFLSFDFCNAPPKKYKQHSVVVSIKSS